MWPLSRGGGGRLRPPALVAGRARACSAPRWRRRRRPAPGGTPSTSCRPTTRWATTSTTFPASEPQDAATAPCRPTSASRRRWTTTKRVDQARQGGRRRGRQGDGRHEGRRPRPRHGGQGRPGYGRQEGRRPRPRHGGQGRQGAGRHEGRRPRHGRSSPQRSLGRARGGAASAFRQNITESEAAHTTLQRSRRLPHRPTRRCRRRCALSLREDAGLCAGAAAGRPVGRQPPAQSPASSRSDSASVAAATLVCVF